MATDRLRKWIMNTLYGSAETAVARAQDQNISDEELEKRDKAAQREAMFHDPAELEPTPEDLARIRQELEPEDTYTPSPQSFSPEATAHKAYLWIEHPDDVSVFGNKDTGEVLLVPRTDRGDELVSQHEQQYPADMPATTPEADIDTSAEPDLVPDQLSRDIQAQRAEMEADNDLSIGE